MFEHIIKAAESLEWSVTNLCDIGFSVPDGMTQFEFEKYSPAGEDFSFTVSGVTSEKIVEKIGRMAEDFDAEEHANEWYNNRHSVSGVPQSLRILLEDAEAIQEMLNELATAASAKQ